MNQILVLVIMNFVFLEFIIIKTIEQICVLLTGGEGICMADQHQQLYLVNKQNICWRLILLDKIQLKRIKERSDAATKGPWKADWEGTNHFEITAPAAEIYWVCLPDVGSLKEKIQNLLLMLVKIFLIC